MDTFLAGLIGGYYVFGRSRSSVNQQIVIYVFARVVLATAALAFQPPGDNALVGGKYGGRGGMGFAANWLGLSEEAREKVRQNAWPVFASLSWASVMWLFRFYPDMLQSSLKSSMTYMYVLPSLLIISLSSSPSLTNSLSATHRSTRTDFTPFRSDMIMRITGIHYEISSYITHSPKNVQRSYHEFSHVHDTHALLCWSLLSIKTPLTLAATASPIPSTGTRSRPCSSTTKYGELSSLALPLEVCDRALRSRKV